MIKSWRILLLMCLLWSSMAAFAVRYPVDSAPRISSLVNILTVQQQQLEKLLDMLTRLDDWKKQLTDENMRLSKEGELAKSDRLKYENGQLSEEDLNRKWHISGRSIQHERDLESFKQEVSDFNAYVKQYNSLTKSMSPVLSRRSPAEVRELVGDIRKLLGILQQAIQDGNLEKARYIARQSAIATEFGYIH